jgi:hypothetical protein
MALQWVLAANGSHYAVGRSGMAYRVTRRRRPNFDGYEVLGFREGPAGIVVQAGPFESLDVGKEKAEGLEAAELGK